MENKLKFIGTLVVAVLLVNIWFLWQVAAQDSTVPLIMVATVIAGAFVILMAKAGADIKEQVSEQCRTRLTELSNAIDSGNFRYSGDSNSDDDKENSLINAQIDALMDKVRLHAEQNAESISQLKSDEVALVDSLQGASVGFMLVAPDRRIKAINESFLNLLSLHQGHIQTSTSANFIGKNVSSVYPQHGALNKLLAAITPAESETLKGNGHTLQMLSKAVGNGGDVLVECHDISSHMENNEDAEEQLRLSSALGAVSTNVMVADEAFNIVYMNDTLKDMFYANQVKFSTAFVGFSVERLIGSNIDVFHKNPSHQRGLLQGLTTEFKSEISVEDLTFELVVNPIFNDEGKRIGTSVEWADLTLAKTQEEQERVNMRMKVALDNVTTNVMMADNDRNIIYVNESLVRMMHDHVSAFKKLSAGFNPDALLGQNIDQFHRNPAHQQSILSNLSDTYKAEISLDELHFELTANPVVDSCGNRLGTVLEWLDITEAKRQQVLAAANARIKVALDSVTTNVMVADAQYNIVYTNDSVGQMLKTAEADLRKDLPHFSAQNIIGKNIDIFHKDPSHQRRMLDRLTASYDTKITVGGRHFNLIATPVMSDENKRIGVVVEWDDITQQTIVEKDVETLVNGVSKGLLDTQINLSGKDGFFLNISEGLNKLTQTINLFVKDINVSVEQMAEGNLNSRITNEYQGAFGNVTDSVNATIDKLNSILKQIQSSSAEINTANEEISRGNYELSNRTEQQASSLQQTAASLEELTSNIRNTANNAKVANNAADGAKNEAGRGEQIMNNAKESMAAITESSNRIVEIISVIDEIAFQTNLLALNASVEAARAGDQGRGFAVVANEVRNLAQRSAVSAKEIKELIDVSSERVQSGSDLVNRCAKSLGDILVHANELSGIIGEIATATNEQATGVGEINQAVAQLDNITQQNAALSEEVTSASQSSLTQVEGMVQQVAYFTVDDAAAEKSQSKKTVSKSSRSHKTELEPSVTRSRTTRSASTASVSARATSTRGATSKTTSASTNKTSSGSTYKSAAKTATTKPINKPKPSPTITAKAKAKAKATATKTPIKPASNNVSIKAKMDDGDDWEEF